MVELSAGKKISLILASTVEILRHHRNTAEEGCENRHGREADTEEENEMAEPTVAFVGNRDTIAFYRSTERDPIGSDPFRF
ncbi:hypothetical protein L484_010403 [Morus notabilis]|uniref:Uncharacterized protein n=1 Tax=Morus notabilis TaxID=981085 RepID=W9SNS0_9ROSA|nr:hypothetical protein L484_010403 [Morus notabilis]